MKLRKYLRVKHNHFIKSNDNALFFYLNDFILSYSRAFIMSGYL
jgi:hypothetical protein